MDGASESGDAELRVLGLVRPGTWELGEKLSIA